MACLAPIPSSPCWRSLADPPATLSRPFDGQEDTTRLRAEAEAASRQRDAHEALCRLKRSELCELVRVTHARSSCSQPHKRRGDVV
jgi:hypothetical protein